MCVLGMIQISVCNRNILMLLTVLFVYCYRLTNGTVDIEYVDICHCLSKDTSCAHCSYTVIANNKLVQSILHILKNCVSIYLSLIVWHILLQTISYLHFIRCCYHLTISYYVILHTIAAVCFDTLSVHLTYHYSLMWLLHAFNILKWVSLVVFVPFQME